MYKWLRAIMDERGRQVKEEGWSIEHDDKYIDGSLANAAACYAATTEVLKNTTRPGVRFVNKLWPWESEWNKKHTHGRKKQLIIAGALIVAELERLERAGEI